MVSSKYNLNSPVVSVCVQTYQHASYIRNALDSILMQQTNFDFEIVLGEDESTDGTRDICIEYAKKYHEKIRLFLNSRKNVIYIDGRPTGRWNFLNNLKNARGKYIALLPGDDYWTDPLKLQRQVTLLDQHPELVSCFHWADWLLDDTGEIASWKYGPPEVKATYSLNDLLRFRNFIPTCSALFRNNRIKKFPDWYYKVDIGDLPLHMILAQYGEIGFVDKVMAVSRRHLGGMYGGNSLYNNLHVSLRAFTYTGRNMELNKRESYRIGLASLYRDLTRASSQGNKVFESILNGIRAIVTAPMSLKGVFGYRILKILCAMPYKILRNLTAELWL